MSSNVDVNVRPGKICKSSPLISIPTISSVNILNLSNVLDSCGGTSTSFEVAIFIVSKNLYGCAVLRIKVSETSLIFFAAPTAVAV